MVTIHSFNKHLWSSRLVPGIILGMASTALDRQTSLCSWNLLFTSKRQLSKEINEYIRNTRISGNDPCSSENRCVQGCDLKHKK